jgi:hypothetical protein
MDTCRHLLALLILGTASTGLVSCHKDSEKPAPAPPEQIATLAAELRRDVDVLAVSIGPRHAGHSSLARAENHIAAELRAAGLAVERQPFEAGGSEAANLVAEIPGTEATPRGIVVVGAHYDTISTTPGADDNASGVAALLALARRFAGSTPSHTLRFAAFANEEPPFFQTPGMGSVVYAGSCRARGDRIVAMIALESLGCFNDAPGSQRYPPVLGWFYPSRGDSLAIVGNRESGRLVKQIVESFHRHADLPCEGASLPGRLPGVGWSDHWAFWREGYPAVMATDTAPFRNPHYHRSTDTPSTLGFDRMARAVLGLEQVVRELAGLPPPPAWPDAQALGGAVPSGISGVP